MPRLPRFLVVSGTLVTLALSGAWALHLRAARAEAQAQAATAPPGVDPVLLNTFKWRSVGPDRGGRSIAVSGVKGRPNEGYFGATGGGLWQTIDKGESGTPVT